LKKLAKKRSFALNNLESIPSLASRWIRLRDPAIFRVYHVQPSSISGRNYVKAFCGTIDTARLLVRQATHFTQFFAKKMLSYALFPLRSHVRENRSLANQTEPSYALPV
jgi:hypothetical protein